MDESMTYQQLKDKLKKLNDEQLSKPVMLKDTVYGSYLRIKGLEISDGDYLPEGEPFITY